MELFILIFFISLLILVSAAIINAKCYRPGPPSTVDIPTPRKKFNLGMEIHLSMKAIIRWEQLRNKSFSLMDYTNKDDIDSLLYTATISSNEGITYTFDVFRHTLSNDEIVREMIKALELETVVLNQFQEKQEEANLGSTDTGPGMIGELVSMLILSGLDAHYVLNEMELCDLPMYIEAYERKKKEQMESDRLWTYLSILPHIDASKLKQGAKDLITFPWEEEEAQKEADREIEEHSEHFEYFMKEGINIIKS